MVYEVPEYSAPCVLYELQLSQSYELRVTALVLLYHTVLVSLGLMHCAVTSDRDNLVQPMSMRYRYLRVTCLGVCTVLVSP